MKKTVNHPSDFRDAVGFSEELTQIKSAIIDAVPVNSFESPTPSPAINVPPTALFKFDPLKEQCVNKFGEKGYNKVTVHDLIAGNPLNGICADMRNSNLNKDCYN